MIVLQINVKFANKIMVKLVFSPLMVDLSLEKAPHIETGFRNTLI